MSNYPDRPNFNLPRSLDSEVDKSARFLQYQKLWQRKIENSKKKAALAFNSQSQSGISPTKRQQLEIQSTRNRDRLDEELRDIDEIIARVVERFLPYEVLNISPNASGKEIFEAHMRMTNQFHEKMIAANKEWNAIENEAPENGFQYLASLQSQWIEAKEVATYCDTTLTLINDAYHRMSAAKPYNPNNSSLSGCFPWLKKKQSVRP